MHEQARRSSPPSRVRSPTDRQFASGCSPRRFGPTQLPSATELWHTPTRTFTVLMWHHHRRTHSRGNGNPEPFEIPGFRVALAIASLPGMTTEFCNELQIHHTSDLSHFTFDDCRDKDYLLFLQVRHPERSEESEVKSAHS